MRRIFLTFLAWLLLAAPIALAQNAGLDAIFSEVEALQKAGCTQEVSFEASGPWLSAIVTQEGTIAPMMEGTQTIGLVFEQETGARIAWDDLFTDGDAAAARMEDIAEAATYRNAYAEFDDLRPMPRDSFAVTGAELTVYYPAQQLFTFSGRSGGFSFYAYELDGLLAGETPLSVGDTALAADALAQALTDGALPGFLSEWTVGRPMAEAKDALGLDDVPDRSHDYALYRFDAPQMRGITLLSSSEDVETAVIEGIMAERIDFSGLCPGVQTRADCVAALGEPDTVEEITGADAYSRLPDGVSLVWNSMAYALRMHFVDDCLHSVTLI